MRILIADNAHEVVDMLKEILVQHGQAVDAAFDGGEAMEFLQRVYYDLVFLDHDMPELTGLELVRYIRSQNMKTKIIMISGYPAMQDFFVKTVGADEYIPKPFSIEAILNVVAKYDAMLKRNSEAA